MLLTNRQLPTRMSRAVHPSRPRTCSRETTERWDVETQYCASVSGICCKASQVSSSDQHTPS